VYERFTDRARKVMQCANQEAQRLNHEYIGTEHIILGLVKEGSGIAASVLKNFGIGLRKIRTEVEKIVGRASDEQIVMGKIPHSPLAKKVIEYAIEEARNLTHNYVGTEHVLLGLLRVPEGDACQVLVNLGLKLEDVREETLKLLGRSDKNEDEMTEGYWLASATKLFGICCLMPQEKEVAKPPTVYIDKQIDDLCRAKDVAVELDDWELAASIRDKADKLKKRRDAEELLRRQKEEPLRDAVEIAVMEHRNNASNILLRAVARAWTHEKNASKVLDNDLIDALMDELTKVCGFVVVENNDA